MNTRIIATAAPVILAAGSARADAYNDGYHGHMWDGGMMMGGGLLMLLIAVAVIVGLGALAWKGLSGSPHRATGHAHDPALSALRDRYARGEIDEAEYQARKRVLEN